MTIEHSGKLDSLLKLDKWITIQDYKGWDPFDALNSRLFEHLKNPYIRMILIQINKYSVVNLRPALLIETSKDPKGIFLIIQAYSMLYDITKNEEYKDKIRKLLPIFESNSLRDIYKFDCWASHYFQHVGIDKSELEPNSPDIIGTCQAIIALVKSYSLLKENTLKEMAISATHLLFGSFLDRSEDGYFFKYTLSEENKIVLNASAQALEAISQILTIYKNENFIEDSKKVVSMLIKEQRTDGSWIYSKYSNGKERIQLDFHQGYMIDGLLAIQPFMRMKDDKNLILCIEKGIDFYEKKLFRKDGRSYYRYPSFYPIDIHNQAQGIITFSKLGKLNYKYLEFVEKITDWTILNMQDPEGYFYYQKHRFSMNKIPYIRWGQAWMLLALATYLNEYKSE